MEAISEDGVPDRGPKQKQFVFGSDRATIHIEDGKTHLDDMKLWRSLARKTLNMRKNILSELLTTERNYISDLRLLIGLFLQPARADSTLLSDSDINAIFLNIEIIFAVNVQLLEKLEVLFLEGINGESMIGPIFTKIVDFLKVYAFYCSNYKKSIFHSHTCEKNNPNYSKFIKEMSEHPACNGLSIYDYLIKPVQRLCKYPLLFRELEKFTPHDHEDYEGVRNIIKKVQEAADVANKIAAGQENLEKLVAFNETVVGFHGFDHFKDGRRAIRDEWLLVRGVGPTGQIQTAPRHVYLFSDMIILTKLLKRGDKSHKIERFKNVIIINEMSFKDVEDSKKQKHCIEITIIAGQFLLVFPSPKSKQIWLEDLNERKTEQNDSTDLSQNINQAMSKHRKPFKVGGLLKKRSKKDGEEDGKKSRKVVVGKAATEPRSASSPEITTTKTLTSQKSQSQLPRNPSDHIEDAVPVTKETKESSDRVENEATGSNTKPEEGVKQLPQLPLLPPTEPPPVPPVPSPRENLHPHPQNPPPPTPSQSNTHQPKPPPSVQPALHPQNDIDSSPPMPQEEVHTHFQFPSLPQLPPHPPQKAPPNAHSQTHPELPNNQESASPKASTSPQLPPEPKTNQNQEKSKPLGWSRAVKPTTNNPTNSQTTSNSKPNDRPVSPSSLANPKTDETSQANKSSVADLIAKFSIQNENEKKPSLHLRNKTYARPNRSQKCLSIRMGDVQLDVTSPDLTGIDFGDNNANDEDNFDDSE